MPDILLSIILILIGTIVAVMGLIGWKTKNIRILLGFFRQIKVDTDKYVKYMGIATIFFGLFYVVLGIWECFSEISSSWFLIGFGVYVFLILYGEKKYKIENP